METQRQSFFLKVGHLQVSVVITHTRFSGFKLTLVSLRTQKQTPVKIEGDSESKRNAFNFLSNLYSSVGTFESV